MSDKGDNYSDFDGGSDQDLDDNVVSISTTLEVHITI